VSASARMRILFLGDIISKSGRKALAGGLTLLKARLAADLCIGNVENAAGIFGITQKVIDEIVACGVDIMTSGNHVWDKREGLVLLDSRENLLRPANYPPGVPGRGFVVRELRGTPFAVINLQGRTFMTPIDCPFRCADAILSDIPSGVKIVLVDFHAEATSEKQALAAHLDGRVSAVVGTHTHVQTADERVLPGGTGFITDVGMVGPIDSVIGVRKEQVIERFMRALPVRFEVSEGPACIGGFLVDVDDATGLARNVLRVREEIEINGEQ
jgi:metallophosphoesterase (TIGR00282 family)